MEATVKAALVRCCACTEVLVPSLACSALVGSSVVRDLWLGVLVGVVWCPCDAVLTPSVVEDVLVLCLSDAEVEVVFWLVEWVESGAASWTVGLESTSKHKEAGAGRSTVLIFERVARWQRIAVSSVGNWLECG